MMTIKSLERIINLFYYSGFIYYLIKRVINFLKVENDSHQPSPPQFKDLNYFQPLTIINQTTINIHIKILIQT